MTQNSSQCSGVVSALFFLIIGFHLCLWQHSNCYSGWAQVICSTLKKLRLWKLPFVYRLLAAVWNASLESKLVSTWILMTSLKFSGYFFSLSINLLLKRGSCSGSRIPSFEWTLVHYWPRTIMLEISPRHQTLAILLVFLGAPEVIFCPKECDWVTSHWKGLWVCFHRFAWTW